MAETNQIVKQVDRLQLGTGWLPDIPDFRDYTVGDKAVRQLFRKGPPKPAKLPGAVDLRESCSPIEDQGSIHACYNVAVMVSYLTFPEEQIMWTSEAATIQNRRNVQGDSI